MAVTKHVRGLATPIVAAVLAGLIALTGGAALATKSVGDRFAEATFEKLGGGSDEVLDALAEKLVDKLSDEGGTLDDAQEALVAELSGMAGKKLDGVDVEALLAGVQADVSAAGLSKLDEIETDAIVDDVTAALIARASGELDDVDIDALARGLLKDLANDVDFEKLVKDELAKIDTEKLVSDVIKTELDGGGSSAGGSNWLSLLFNG